jgi:hypothetical protein
VRSEQAKREREATRLRAMRYTPPANPPARQLDPVSRALQDAHIQELILRNLGASTYDWRAPADPRVKYSEDAFKGIIDRFVINYEFLLDDRPPPFHQLFVDAKGRQRQVDGFERAREIKNVDRVFFCQSVIESMVESFLSKSLFGQVTHNVPDGRICDDLAILDNCYFRLLCGELVAADPFIFLFRRWEGKRKNESLESNAPKHLRSILRPSRGG